MAPKAYYQKAAPKSALEAAKRARKQLPEKKSGPTAKQDWQARLADPYPRHLDFDGIRSLAKTREDAVEFPVFPENSSYHREMKKEMAGSGICEPILVKVKLENGEIVEKPQTAKMLDPFDRHRPQFEKSPRRPGYARQAYPQGTV